MNQANISRTQIIVSLTGRDEAELVKQIRNLRDQRQNFDWVEWRIDYLTRDLSELLPLLHNLRKQINRELGPTFLIGTFRTALEGGNRTLSFAHYTRLLFELAYSGKFDCVDVQGFFSEPNGRRASELIAQLKQGYPELKVIASYHDFMATPSYPELTRRLEILSETGADYAKLACMPKTHLDVLTLLAATAKARQKLNLKNSPCQLITMSMGDLGVLSRLVGVNYGSVASFAMVGQASAPGQVPAASLRTFLEQLEPLLFSNRK